MANMYISPLTRVTPAPSSLQNVSRDFRITHVSPIKSSCDSSSLPRLITYDIFEKKTPQQLLYESAQATPNTTNKKWQHFVHEFKKHDHHRNYRKQLLKHLDDANQWAALHYAVFNGNEDVFNFLTDKKSQDKLFRCDINIKTGNGENALHIAARSSTLWDSSSPPSEYISVPVENGKQVELPRIINELIKRGVGINHANDEGRTPLHLAVMKNHLPLVKLLLSKNANIYAKTKLCLNVFHFAFIPSGQTATQLSDMWKCLKDGLQSPKTTSCYVWSNAQPNLTLMCTIDNRTPLVFALCHPQITEAIIQDLLKSMTNNSEDLDPNQIFIAIGQVARQSLDSYDILTPVLEACNSDTFNQLLHLPCRYNNSNLLKWLIQQTSKVNNRGKSRVRTSKKLDLDVKDHAGYTPLLTAAFYSSTECVDYLLTFVNADIRSDTSASSLSIKLAETNNDGENILHICAKHHESEKLFNIIWDRAVKLKLPESRDNNGNLPFHVIAENNQESMCNKFLTYCTGSNRSLLFVKNKQGQTAVHVAINAKPHRIGPERHFAGKHRKDKNQNLKGNKEKEKEKEEEEDDDDDDEHDFGLPIIQFLWKTISKDSSPNVLFERDADGKTCLHLAAENGHIKIVKFLVEDVLVEIDPIADRRLTPLHLACKNGHRKIIAYLIEHGASPIFRTAELHNALEIAIINQNESTVKELLTLPNWRELMHNAQPINNSEAYDTPMRKLIRYLPNIAVWMIEKKLTRIIGGHGKHVFKKVYDYEFYMDVYQVKQWYQQDVRMHDEKESFCERWHRRGCTAISFSECCCCHMKKEDKGEIPYTDDAYTLIRNHPLIIASEQSQYPALVNHPYNTFLRELWYRKNARFYYIVRGISFTLYAAFLAIWTAIILMGKHPQYFYQQIGLNMTLDLATCANVSRTLTAANDSEALKTTTYKNLKSSLYAFLMLFVVENIILIFALFPRVFRTVDYLIEISAFIFTFVYIYDWADWQNPVLFRCPIQYQIGSMGILLAWLSLLTYVKRSTLFDIGVFVAMLQVIGYKFIRFIPVLLVIVCGFGFTNWMLLQNQDVFADPVQAVIRTGLLMFELNYEEHLYKNQIYYQIIFFITVLTAIVFCIFILNLLISVAVGEVPSLTDKGKIWQSQMLYDLVSDYSIVSIQMIGLLNFVTRGYFGHKILRLGLEPNVVREHDLTGNWCEDAWKYVQRNFLDEKIQDDIISIKTVDDTKKDEK